MFSSVFTLAVSLFFSCLLVTAGWQKRQEQAYLSAIIKRYEIVPSTWAAPLAQGLPWLEMGLGVALLVPLLQPSALVATFILFGSYTAAIAINVYRGRREIDCGCAGPHHVQPISMGLVVRNSLLLLSLGAALAIAPASLNLQLGVWLLAFTIALVAVLFYFSLQQLISNQHYYARTQGHG